MNTTRDWNLLTINAGSSSLKVALYQMGSLDTCLLTANVERIGSPVSRITIAYKNRDRRFGLESVMNWSLSESSWMLMRTPRTRR